MHCLAAAVLLICAFQNLLLSCDGRSGNEDPVGLLLSRQEHSGPLILNVTYQSRTSSEKTNFECTLRKLQQKQTLEVDKDSSIRNPLNDNLYSIVFQFKTTPRAGYVLCLYKKDGQVIVASDELFIRDKGFVAVIKPHQIIALNTMQKFVGNNGTVEQISADPLVFHVHMDQIMDPSPERDYQQLEIFKRHMAKLTGTDNKMTILSTRYCPPVPSLSIPVKYYSPGKKYQFNDAFITCGGDYFEGADWKRPQMQESLRKLDLLIFENTILSNIINDARNFSATLNAIEFVHERELPVLANLFNQLQISNILNDSEFRHNTSNELIANAEAKIYKLPLTKNFVQEVRDNFFVRVENISQTRSTGVVLVDWNENINNNFQNVSSLNESTNIAQFFTLTTRLAILLPYYILDDGIQKISYMAYRNINALIDSEKCPMTSVISATINGGHRTHLKKPVKIWFRRESDQLPGKCVHWDFSAKNGAGLWSTEGCILVGSHRLSDSSFLDECHCWHLTNFGQLFWNSEYKYYDECVVGGTHEETLKVISMVVLVTTLVALAGVIITAIIFPKRLKDPGQKIILQMSVNLALLLIFFAINSRVEVEPNGTGCLILGLILHYFLLTNLVWMAIAGFLQYHRLVTVLYARTNKIVLKTGVIAWGVPIIPGAVVLISGQPQVYSQPPLCLPQNIAFYLTILAPLILTLASNAVVFALIAKNLFLMSEVRAHVDRYVSIRRFKQLLFLFTLFGLNWMFGLLQNIYPEFRVLFGYLFCISLAIQGVAYFTFFVLMQDHVIKRLLTFFNRNKESSLNLTALKQRSYSDSVAKPNE